MLCKKHSECCFTCDIGKCTRCEERTSSGAFMYCDKCSKELSACCVCGDKPELYPEKPSSKEPGVDDEEISQEALEVSCKCPYMAQSKKPSTSEPETRSPAERALWWTGVGLATYIGYKMYF